MSSQESVRFVKGAVCRPGQRTVAGSCGTPGRERLLSREKSEELLKSLYVARLCHRSLKTPSQTAECVGSQAGRKSGAVIKHKELEKGKREREKEKEGKKGGGEKAERALFGSPITEHSIGREAFFSTPQEPPSWRPKKFQPSQATLE